MEGLVNKSDTRPKKLTVPYAGRVYDDHELSNLHKAADEFWLTEGRWCARFENGLKRFLGVEHCRLTNSGSSANLLAVSALELKPGDEVITCAVGFPTTVAPIIQNRGVPVFVDVSRDTANIDVSYLNDALSSRTVAVILAHTLGNPFNVRAVLEFCVHNGLTLIEDNCDALGSKYAGHFTGTFGDIATSSFYPAHHITTGEGGAVYTNSNELDTIMASFRDWGRDCYCKPGKANTCGCRFTQQHGSLPFGYDHKYTYSRFGYNLKMTDPMAAVGVAQLDKLRAPYIEQPSGIERPSFGDARRRNWAYLRESLHSVSEVIHFASPTEHADPSWFGFLMTVKDDAPFTRDQIVAHLENAKIQTRTLFAGNMTRQPCFNDLKRGVDYRVIGDLPVADRFMNRAFWVGVYPGLSQEQLDYMVERILEVAA